MIEMLKLCTISVLIITSLQVSDAESDQNDSLPVQSYPWDDMNLERMYHKIDKLECSAEVLIQQLKQLNMKFDTMVNQVKAEENRVNREIASEKKRLPSNCAEALIATEKSGVHMIKVNAFGFTPFEVYCNEQPLGGNWTVIQRRQDGSEDFFRGWSAYKEGFGNLQGEFWLGLDKIHALTAESPQELLIELEDFENEKRYARYDYFRIGWEGEEYALKALGSYSGNAKDSLNYHRGMKFSTKDHDNDADSRNCAALYKGAWWYSGCHNSNLNGLYVKGKTDQYAVGVIWYDWKGHYYSLKSTQMMIRPKMN